MNNKRQIIKMIIYIICGIFLVLIILNYRNGSHLDSLIRVYVPLVIVVLLFSTNFIHDDIVRPESESNDETAYHGKAGKRRKKYFKCNVSKFNQKISIALVLVMMISYIYDAFLSCKSNKREEQRFKWEQDERRKQQVNELRDETCQKDSIRLESR
jgi:uncharacterized membrane protein YqhA